MRHHPKKTRPHWRDVMAEFRQSHTLMCPTCLEILVALPQVRWHLREGHFDEVPNDAPPALGVSAGDGARSGDRIGG